MDHPLDDPGDGPALDTEALIHCPHCSARVAADAESCFRCGKTLLFDVTIEAPLAHSQRRYQVAKALAAAAPAEVPEDAQAQLALAGGKIGQRLTRARAQPLVEVLERNGLSVHLFPSEPLAAEAPIEAVALTPTRGPPRTGRGLGMAGVLVVVFIAGLIRLMGQSQAVTGAGPKRVAAARSTREIAASAIDSTAVVRCARTLGAGFFVAPDKLVTNDHVLCDDGQDPEVDLHDGRKLMGTVVSRDPVLDLAVLRVLGAAAKPLPVGDASSLAVGDKIVLIGAPRGLEFTVHEGTVSYNGRVSYGVSYVQFEGNVNPGNSGGPLLDAQGRVVGVVSMMLADSNGIGLALPINYLYGGARPILKLDRAPPESAAWKAMLERATAADDAQAKDFVAMLQRPGLADAMADHGAIYAVVLLNAGKRPPQPTSLHFTLVDGAKTLCQADARVTDWTDLLDARMQRRSSRMLGWLRAHHLERDLFGALLRIDLPGCTPPPGHHELVLGGGDPRVNTAVVEM